MKSKSGISYLGKPLLLSVSFIFPFISGTSAYAQDATYTPGWIVGAEGALVTPHFDRDLIGYDRKFGPTNDLEMLSFDWHANGTYRGWLGYEWTSGFGVSLSHSILNQSTDFSQVEGTGQLESHFDLTSGDASIYVDGALIAKNTLKMDVTDLEFWQRANFTSMKLRYGAGLRYANIDRKFAAYETENDEFILFNHDFHGIGPSLNYEVEIPIRAGFSLYNSGRAALLFGRHRSDYQGESNFDAGTTSNTAMLPTFDAEAGIQWQGQLGNAPGEWTFRAGVDSQVWFNGGGWDLGSTNAGSYFPQQAGSFGLWGLNVSAQYKFGAAPLEKEIQPRENLTAIVSQGWFVGIEGALVTPYFESDVLGADEQAGSANTLEVLSFDWDADGAYRGWVGHEWASGFGVSLSHSILNQSTNFARDEGTGNLVAHFDQNSNDASIFVDGALIANNTLKMDVSDLEFWQKADLGSMMLRYGAGLRYANIERRYFAYETGGNEFIRFNHDFHGVGPSLNYEVEVPIRAGFSLYNSGRAAILFGNHKSNYETEVVGRRGASSNAAMLPTLDMEVGMQWQGQLGNAPGEWTLRAGIDGQTWFNGGGWDLFKDQGGANFPQTAGSFGLLAFNVSAQYKFGASPLGKSAQPRENLPKIVTAGFFVGAEGALLTPHFERDILGADRNFGPANDLELLSFDWHADAAYKGWVGYEWASGLGFSLSHSTLSQSTGFSQEEGTARYEASFDLGISDPDISVDGAFVVTNTLKMDVTDLEFWQAAEFTRLKLRYGAGLRYANVERRYFAYETGGNEFIRFNHDFKGLGPSLNYEVEVPIRAGFSLYNSGRVALLFGEHKSNFQGERATNDAGASSNKALVPTLDGEVGIQWQGHLGNAPGEWTLRAGVDGQAWINGGGWDLYQDDGGADLPQFSGSYGLWGAKLSAQYKF